MSEWKLVPVEPTEEMVSAGEGVTPTDRRCTNIPCGLISVSHLTVGDIWDAMLAAAPPSAAPAEPTGAPAGYWDALRRAMDTFPVLPEQPGSYPDPDSEPVAAPAEDTFIAARHDDTGNMWWGPRSYVAGLERKCDGLQLEVETSTKFIRVLTEEFVIAGYPGGDRETVLQNVRRVLASLRADAGLKRAANRAAAELPDGYSVDISIERGAASVYMCDREGKSISLDVDSDDRLVAEINAAVDAALAASARKP